MVLRRSASALALAALVVVLAGACSKSSGGPDVASVGTPAGTGATPSASASADRTDQLRAFAQCMRDQGVDVKDPQAGAGIGGLAGMGDGIDANDPKVQAAFTACQSKLPNGGQPPKLNPQQVALYLQFAACMRDNGVDLPDPSADGSLQFTAGGAAVLQDPGFQKALTACRDKLTGLLPSAAGAPS
jgi:hypothetical protein